ncbi:MAG: AfsR/SARP family transcriptional regulator [Acidimicrobiia bacterium]|nr:AfsR/SARP family transcriptional regulator [Acidimicrobiia bacterium]
MTPPITFGILGPIVINRPDGTSSHPTGREAKVLAAMLLSINKSIPTFDLISIVWGDSPPASPETALHNVVYRLRRTLEDTGVAATIEKAADGYGLMADPMVVDAARFEWLLATADRENGATAREVLDDAMDLWRGEPFGSRLNGSQLFHAETQRLTALRWLAVEDRIRHDLASGGHREVIPELVGLTTMAPIRETLWAFLIAALYLSDQRGRALQAYQQARAHLAEAIGVEPGRPLQELVGAVVDQDDYRVLEFVKV